MLSQKEAAMRLSQTIGLSAILLALGCGIGLAQTPAPATSTPESTAPAASGPETKGIAKECSSQATAKGLHGKERRKFRADCKKTGGKPG
jgi:psiF repeat